MKYSIRVNEVKKEDGNVRGFATVVFGDSFKITNIAIVENKDKGQLFVSMPRYKSSERDESGATVYKDVCNPITAELRIEEDPISICKVALLELGYRKKRILEYSEVEEVAESYQITDIKIINEIIEYLENNNVDILLIEEETHVSQTKSYWKKYATEEERRTARMKSLEKYRKKQNIQNEYSINQTVHISQKNPYEKRDEDMELLRDIVWGDKPF